MTLDRYGASGVSSRANALSLTKTWFESVGSIPKQVTGTRHAYFVGGYPGVSTLERLEYANDTVNALKIGYAGYPQVRYARGVSSMTHGYIVGGNTPFSSNHGSKVQRISYANDTEVASLRGALATVPPPAGSFQSGGAFGNISYGYYAAGGGYSSIWRIDYSNDTATAPEHAHNVETTHMINATGNENFGYMGGNGPSASSRVIRLDYSSDTATPSVKGPLSVTKKRPGAAGNSNYGYFCGGEGGGESTISRIDYSNDTATASTKGPLSAARYSPTGSTGNKDYGYISGGGPAPSAVQVTWIERIDYSNDTATAVKKSNLGTAIYQNAAFSGAENALPQ